MTDAQLAHKWNCNEADLKKVWAAMEAKDAVHGFLYAEFIHTFLSWTRVGTGSVDRTVGDREIQDGAALVIDPVVISIIFGVLSLVGTVLAPAMKPIINQIISFLNTILPVPLPPVP